MTKVEAVFAGQCFYSLTVVDKFQIQGRKSKAWFCRCLCSCGVEKITRLQGLLSGRTKSCGCFQKASFRARSLGSAHNTSHGHKRGNRSSKTYNTWRSINQRCCCKSHAGYKNYGARGITVCDRWRKFENFLEDMGERPRGMTIERKRNDGNYEPANCIWADNFTQANNKRTNRRLTFAGESHTVKEWSLRHGITATLIIKRLDDLKWTVERTLTTPSRQWVRKS